MIGPEGAPLTTRAVGTGYQASWDALFFKFLAYSGSDAYYAMGRVSSIDLVLQSGDLVLQSGDTSGEICHAYFIELTFR